VHDEGHLEEGDSSGCAGTSTSFVAGVVEMTFSGGGETDFPFLPNGAGIPFGQGVRRRTRGLSAVFAGARTECVLSRELSRAFLGLVSAFGDTAEGFKRRRRSNQWVGIQESNQHAAADARTFMRSTGTRRALDTHHLTGRLLAWFHFLGKLLV
jgi:hypothetical protein